MTVYRTIFHEAGHTVVYWDLFAMLSKEVVATSIFNAGTGGYASLDQIDHSYDDYLKLSAVYYSGMAAVQIAIEKELIPSVLRPEYGYERPVGDKATAKPYYDEDWVEFLSVRTASICRTQSSNQENWEEPETISSRAKDMAMVSLHGNWSLVTKLTTALQNEQVIQRPRLRDIFTG